MNIIKKFNLLLLNLSPYEFTTVSILIGYLLSEGLDGLQTSSLGNFYESVGQVLETLGAQMQNKEVSADINYEECYNELKKKIGNLDEIIADLNTNN